MSKEVRVYTSESSVRHPRIFLAKMWKDFMLGRDLAKRLAIRDFRAQYRQSFLGIFWVFVLPLANTLTWLFLRSSGVVTINETEIPYPVYVFTGTMIWSIFTESIQAPLQKVSSNKSLLSKINFPREALILSSFYQVAANSVIKIGIMLVGMIFFRYNFVGISFPLFPLAILSLILLGIATGLLLTPLGVLYSDDGKGLSVVMQFLMYLSPVVFAVPKIGWMAKFMNYNPVTPLVVTARAWITGNPTLFLNGFIEVSIVSVIVLGAGWVIYRASMPILIERISS